MPSPSCDGDLDKLPLEVAIDRPFHARVDGSALTLTHGWHFEGTGDIARLRPRSPSVAARRWDSSRASSTSHVDQTGFTATGPLDPAGLAAGPIDVDFAGSYAEKQVADRAHRTAATPASRTHMILRGSVEVVTGGPALDLTG